ncbi:MAG: hypothetical protein ACOYES_08650 [Bacillota bacterium]
MKWRGFARTAVMFAVASLLGWVVYVAVDPRIAALDLHPDIRTGLSIASYGVTALVGMLVADRLFGKGGAGH